MSTTISNTPAEIVDVAKDALLHKAKAPLATKVTSAMFAGAMIALGFVFYVTSQNGSAGMPYGLAKVVGGIVFSVGLGLVVITGADLFTSTSMTPILLKDKLISPVEMVLHWVVVYLGNMLGAFLIVLFIFFGGTAHQGHGGWGAVVINTALSKTSHSFSESVCLGIMCNIFVCLAVWLAYAGKTVSDKVLALTLPIGAFVATGFEHSVANMFMIPLALLLKGQADPAVMEAMAGTDISGLTISSYLIHNLVPVTIGNLIGGSIIALGMAYWHRERVHHA
ncbi:formate/nitrite family transporter [Corynebacterium sp. H127]|uniref:formate/nitrite family transporter n=1 Tax=Corynebacterium sp. H127 TaxID=3133418 RepID=UPI0030B463DB